MCLENQRSIMEWRFRAARPVPACTWHSYPMSHDPYRRRNKTCIGTILKNLTARFFIGGLVHILPCRSLAFFLSRRHFFLRFIQSDFDKKSLKIFLFYSASAIMSFCLGDEVRSHSTLSVLYFASYQWPFSLNSSKPRLFSHDPPIMWTLSSKVSRFLKMRPCVRSSFGILRPFSLFALRHLRRSKKSRATMQSMPLFHLPLIRLTCFFATSLLFLFPGTFPCHFLTQPLSLLDEPPGLHLSGFSHQLFCNFLVFRTFDIFSQGFRGNTIEGIHGFRTLVLIVVSPVRIMRHEALVLDFCTTYKHSIAAPRHSRRLCFRRPNSVPVRRMWSPFILLAFCYSRLSFRSIVSQNTSNAFSYNVTSST